ncbi:MAG: hypothetical protein KY462_02685 [Actinobacteria bacterium]|nr:hypothetical protein [Actinomycetota bacterium]
MDLRDVIVSAPLLWRAWKWLPGPLKVIVVAASAIVWLKRRSADRERPAGAGARTAEGR